MLLLMLLLQIKLSKLNISLNRTIFLNYSEHKLDLRVIINIKRKFTEERDVKHNRFCLIALSTSARRSIAIANKKDNTVVVYSGVNSAMPAKRRFSYKSCGAITASGAHKYYRSLAILLTHSHVRAVPLPEQYTYYSFTKNKCGLVPCVTRNVIWKKKYCSLIINFIQTNSFAFVYIFQFFTRFILNVACTLNWPTAVVVGVR